jgi:predicted nucleic acid-binding protein
MRALVDTNVLLRWSDADSPRHPECVEAVDAAVRSGYKVYACAQVLVEYWVTATRPRDVNGFGLSFSHAEQNVKQVLESFPLLPEVADIGERWQSVVARHRVMGRQAHDARIVALMLAHNITHLITLNIADFARYDGIVPVVPSEAQSLFSPE